MAGNVVENILGQLGKVFTSDKGSKSSPVKLVSANPDNPAKQNPIQDVQKSMYDAMLEIGIKGMPNPSKHPIV